MRGRSALRKREKAACGMDMSEQKKKDTVIIDDSHEKYDGTWHDLMHHRSRL
jgi:hypothetical protein